MPMLGKLEGENNSKTFLKNVNYFWNEKKYNQKKKNGLISMLIRTNICIILLLS